MTIQKLSFIFYLVTAILISLLTLFMGLRYSEQQELEHFQEKRHASFLAAELRQSSDDLTRMAAYMSTPAIPSLNACIGRYLRSATARRNGR